MDEMTCAIGCTIEDEIISKLVASPSFLLL